MAGRTEEVYAALGLPWIPPEMREGRGEIERTREGWLPRLQELDDQRGDLHVHTTATDGRASLEAMVRGLTVLRGELLTTRQSVTLPKHTCAVPHSRRT